MPETIRIDFNNLPFTEFLREIFGGQVHKVVTQLFTMKIEIFFCFRMNKLVELAYSNHFLSKITVDWQDGVSEPNYDVSRWFFFCFFLIPVSHFHSLSRVKKYCYNNINTITRCITSSLGFPISVMACNYFFCFDKCLASFRVSRSCNFNASLLFKVWRYWCFSKESRSYSLCSSATCWHGVSFASICSVFVHGFEFASSIRSRQIGARSEIFR